MERSFKKDAEIHVVGKIIIIYPEIFRQTYLSKKCRPRFLGAV